MIKTLTNVLKQDKEKFAVPKKVQDIIPVRSIWTDGVFMTGKNDREEQVQQDVAVHGHQLCCRIKRR